MKKLFFPLLLLVTLSACEKELSFEEQLVGEWEIREQSYKQTDSTDLQILGDRIMRVTFEADFSGQIDGLPRMFWTYLPDHQLVVIDVEDTLPAISFTMNVLAADAEEQLWEQVETTGTGFNGTATPFIETLQWHLKKVK